MDSNMDITHLPEALYLQGEREAEFEEIRQETVYA